MKYIDEYRDIRLVEALSSKIRKAVTRQWNIMEICGGQTHAIMKYNLTSFLPDEINLIHGPGCPVCVTPTEKIDAAIALASKPGVILVSFGDMLRVPGTEKDLLHAKAEGGDVRVVYSPLDCLTIAAENPEKEVVFFAIGFETTAPVNALAIIQAHKMGIRNFSILCSQVLVVPAMEFILSSPGNLVQGFLAAGHVCTVTGYRDYIPVAQKYGTPMAITGFEPVDILQGILAVVLQLEAGTCMVTNEYNRSVTIDGNLPAIKALDEAFEISGQDWRGIGIIPQSGLILKKAYEGFDAEKRFSISIRKHTESNQCMAGEILQGRIKPFECKSFGAQCTPENPLGAPMVSQEGACAAYYRFKTNNYGNKLSNTRTEA
jgi:hydrogenase expression/formation protein HypD